MAILYVLAWAAFLLFCAFIVLRSVHMFQLNSYKTATHLRWLRSNLKSLLPGTLGAVAVLAVLGLGLERWLALAVLAAVFAVLAVIQIPPKAKKKLVFTKRVNRMLCTLTLLALLVVLVLGLLLKTVGLDVGMAVLSLLCPVWILVANFVNKPLESGINRYYINDAKKRLKSHRELLTIGVTGSFGKTSVKYILHTLLQAEFDVLKTPESYNTPMGVVKTVRGMLRATHQIFVCEMGARHVGDIQELCDIAEPKMGIITSVGPQHLETFHSVENVAKTKFELSDALPAEGTVFLNMEDDNVRDNAYRVKCNMVSYGLSDRWDYYADGIFASSKGTTFTVHTRSGDSDTFTTKMIGAHNVINIVGAVAVCCELGIPLVKLKPQVRKLEGVPHRLQMIRRQGITIIDDAYNANPSGTKAAIDALSLFDGCRILVTPGMVELGERQDALNREFGAYAAKACDYVMLVGRKQTRSIYQGLLDAGYPEDRIFVADLLQEALEKAYKADAQGKEKVILLENDLPDNF